MPVRRKETGGIVILYPKGSFFGDRETDELHKALMDELSAGHTRLVLNLADCVAMNSMAIGVVMRAFASFRGRGGQLRLCRPTGRVRDLFRMTKLDRVFEPHDTEEQALAVFAQGRSVVG